MRFRMKCTMLIMLAGFILLSSVHAWAEDSSWSRIQDVKAIDVKDADEVKAEMEKDWKVVVGGGMMVKPTYEGSDHYKVQPIPFGSITYRDMISLGMDGLSAYWRHDNFRIGGALTYQGGREDSIPDNIMGDGDDELNGLGDIDGALGVKAFMSYGLGCAILDGEVTKFLGDDNSGLLMNLRVSVPVKLNNKLTLSPHIGATWANQDYMQTFFGVTSTQAANSGFRQFDADAGIKDVYAGINAKYLLNQHWFVNGSVDIKELMGDAADSPITSSNTGVVFTLMVGYNF